MKKILLFIAVVASTLCLSTSCTKYNFVDTGKAIGYHDCSMWEYFQQDPYNWDSLVVMSERAGLQQVFMGTSTYGTNLTVFGITNHSIRRYLLEKGYEQIADIPVEDCRNFILSSIIDGNNVIQLDDFTAGTASTDPNLSSVKVARCTRCCLASNYGSTPIVSHTAVFLKQVPRKST